MSIEKNAGAFVALFRFHGPFLSNKRHRPWDALCFGNSQSDKIANLSYLRELDAGNFVNLGVVTF
jgi:hypothetical protein